MSETRDVVLAIDVGDSKLAAGLMTMNAHTAALQPLIRSGGTAPGCRRSSPAAELP